jgi:hypothetical protein
MELTPTTKLSSLLSDHNVKREELFKFQRTGPHEGEFHVSGIWQKEEGFFLSFS